MSPAWSFEMKLAVNRLLGSWAKRDVWKLGKINSSRLVSFPQSSSLLVWFEISFWNSILMASVFCWFQDNLFSFDSEAARERVRSSEWPWILLSKDQCHYCYHNSMHWYLDQRHFLDPIRSELDAWVIKGRCPIFILLVILTFSLKRFGLKVRANSEWSR